MKQRIYAHAVPLFVFLLSFALLGWASFIVIIIRTSQELQPYGTFGTSQIVNDGLFLVLRDDDFFLYQGCNFQLVDTGTLSHLPDMSYLYGEASQYSLVLTKSSLYLTGGNLEDNTRLMRLESRPILIGFMDPGIQEPDWVKQFSAS